MSNRGRYANIPMPNGCIYLNNDGSRMVTQDMRFVLVLPDGTRKVRLAEFYASFGNFSVTHYRYKGKHCGGLPKAHDGSETRDPQATGDAALPHVFHREG
jgi:hypothetical protein